MHHLLCNGVPGVALGYESTPPLAHLPALLIAQCRSGTKCFNQRINPDFNPPATLVGLKLMPRSTFGGYYRHSRGKCLGDNYPKVLTERGKHKQIRICVSNPLFSIVYG